MKRAFLNGLVSLLGLSSLPCWAAAVPLLPTGLQSRAPSGNKNVIVQLLEWNWDSVAAECTSFIGSAGYAFVQGAHAANVCVEFIQLACFTVSPAQEHITGNQWWTSYQPVSPQSLFLFSS
jgi:hypothetical protein